MIPERSTAMGRSFTRLGKGMKHEIKIPRRIRVGGYDYTIGMSTAFDKELHSDGDKVQASSRLRRIIVSSVLSPQDFSETFIHEILHAVDDIYANSSLIENQNYLIANGLFQVFEQLGIRFVKG